MLVVPTDQHLMLTWTNFRGRATRLTNTGSRSRIADQHDKERPLSHPEWRYTMPRPACGYRIRRYTPLTCMFASPSGIPSGNGDLDLDSGPARPELLTGGVPCRGSGGGM